MSRANGFSIQYEYCTSTGTYVRVPECDCLLRPTVRGYRKSYKKIIKRKIFVNLYQYICQHLPTYLFYSALVKCKSRSFTPAFFAFYDFFYRYFIYTESLLQSCTVVYTCIYGTSTYCTYCTYSNLIGQQIIPIIF